MLKNPANGLKRKWTTVLVIAALGLTSCGSEGVPLYSVQGRALYQGQPMEGAYIVFHPTEVPPEGEKIRPFGRADAEGNFQLTSREPNDGAPAGEYRVTIVWPGPARGIDPANPDPEMASDGPDRLRGRFANPKTTPLHATVKPEANRLDAFEFK